MVIVPKLSSLQCVCYHPIYTEVIEGVYSTTFFTDKKLPQWLYLSYHVHGTYIALIYTKVTSGMFFNNSPSRSKLPRWLDLSYQVSGVSITILIIQKLSGMYINNFGSILLVFVNELHCIRTAAIASGHQRQKDQRETGALPRSKSYMCTHSGEEDGSNSKPPKPSG